MQLQQPIRHSLCCTHSLSKAFSNVSSRHVVSRRGQLVVRNVGWDPEGILAAPVGGHIQRRQMAKLIETNKEVAAQVEEARKQAREELAEKRAARVQPTKPAALVEYFLDTEGEEMEYEAARCRPLLDAAFFSYLTSETGKERFAATPNQDRLTELEALKEYLEAAAAAVDKAKEQALAPLDRLKKLLSAEDKRATLLEMAGNNQVDQALLDLLQQNIDAARSAGQEKPAEFMEKVRTAASKFVMK